MMSPEELVRALAAPGAGSVAPLAAAGWAKGAARESGGAVDVLFNLASVTKPMTALAFAQSGVDRRTPLGDLVAEARGTPSERLPVELFLAHRAGLDAHRKLYAPLLPGAGRPMDVARPCERPPTRRRLDAPGEAPPEGFAPLYSDLGYVLAGVALARAVGAEDAGEAIARLVLEPLGLGSSGGDGAGARGPRRRRPLRARPRRWRGGEAP